MLTALIALIAEALIAYAPAYASNMAPPVAASLRLPGGSPLSPRHLGPGKTYRGVVSGVAAGAVVGLLLHRFHLSWAAVQSPMDAAITGGVMGLGAILGDVVESAVKRRRNLPPGHPWVPWDQIDFIIGSTVLASLLIPMRWEIVLTALVITPPLHFLVNVVSYLLGIKRVWW